MLKKMSNVNFITAYCRYLCYAVARNHAHLEQKLSKSFSSNYNDVYECQVCCYRFKFPMAIDELKYDALQQQLPFQTWLQLIDLALVLWGIYSMAPYWGCDRPTKKTTGTDNMR